MASGGPLASPASTFGNEDDGGALAGFFESVLSEATGFSSALSELASLTSGASAAGSTAGGGGTSRVQGSFALFSTTATHATRPKTTAAVTE